MQQLAANFKQPPQVALAEEAVNHLRRVWALFDKISEIGLSSTVGNDIAAGMVAQKIKAEVEGLCVDIGARIGWHILSVPD